MADELQRAILLAPDLIARAARGTVSSQSTSWMLGQSRHVRGSYVAEVMDRDVGVDQERAQQIWMLSQPDEVRRSYLDEVLSERAEQPSLQVVWMLAQPEDVRLSYVEQVFGAPEGMLKPQVRWMLRQPDAVRESYIREVVKAGAESRSPAPPPPRRCSGAGRRAPLSRVDAALVAEPDQRFPV